MIWRPVTAEHIPDSLITIQTWWTTEDLYDAHEALDILEALDAEAQAKANAKSGKG